MAKAMTVNRNPNRDRAMQITTETPRGDFTIAKTVFSVYVPFSEGDVLTAGEANALNQTFAENIRNNFAKTVKTHLDAGTLDVEALQKALDDYQLEYEFGARRSREPGEARESTPRNPTLTRAIELAREAVRRKIREIGGNIKDYTAADISARAKKAVESNPKFLETAAKQLEEEANIDLSVEGLDSAPEPVEKKAKAPKKSAHAETEAA